MCPATSKHTGEPCGHGAGYLTEHPGYGACRWHAGNTPMGKKNAALLMGTEIKEGWKMRFGGDRTLTQITPEEALLEEVQRSAAFVRWLEERIGMWEIDATEVEDGALPGHHTRNPSAAVVSLAPMRRPPTRPVTDDGTGLPMLIDETTRGTPTPTEVDAWLRLYREERAHLAKAAKMAIDAGIAERHVRLAEDQGKLFAGGIKLILQALALTPEQQAQVPQLVPSIIRQMVSGVQPSLPVTPMPVDPEGRVVYATDLIDSEGYQVPEES